MIVPCNYLKLTFALDQLSLLALHSDMMHILLISMLLQGIIDRMHEHKNEHVYYSTMFEAGVIIYTLKVLLENDEKNYNFIIYLHPTHKHLEEVIILYKVSDLLYASFLYVMI